MYIYKHIYVYIIIYMFICKWHVCLGSHNLDKIGIQESEGGHSKAKGTQGQEKRLRGSGRCLGTKWERARKEGNEEGS